MKGKEHERERERTPLGDQERGGRGEMLAEVVLTRDIWHCLETLQHPARWSDATSVPREGQGR